ncbi:hypothetical protein ACHAXA_000091 [Cyclostephanos tholiformis]|uniref:Uncharacterized protein n=1 Tax=Cyclostephanos tholiformis TaxID=382380 RepID=A0ABD3RW74_9STRA
MIMRRSHGAPALGRHVAVPPISASDYHYHDYHRLYNHRDDEGEDGDGMLSPPPTAESISLPPPPAHPHPGDYVQSIPSQYHQPTPHHTSTNALLQRNYHHRRLNHGHGHHDRDHRMPHLHYQRRASNPDYRCHHGGLWESGSGGGRVDYFHDEHGHGRRGDYYQHDDRHLRSDCQDRDNDGYYYSHDDERAGYYGATPSFRGMMNATNRMTTMANASTNEPRGGERITISGSDASYYRPPCSDHPRHTHPLSPPQSLSSHLATHRWVGSPKAYRELDYSTNRIWQEDDHTYLPYERRRSSASFSSAGSIAVVGPPGVVATTSAFRKDVEDVEGRDGNHNCDVNQPPTTNATTTGRRHSCPIIGRNINLEGRGARKGDVEQSGDVDVLHHLPRFEDDGGGGAHETKDAQRHRLSQLEENSVFYKERRTQDQYGPPRVPEPSGEVHQVRGGACVRGGRRHSSPGGGDVDVAYNRSGSGGAIVFTPPPWHHQAVSPFAPMPGEWDHSDLRACPSGHMDVAYVDGAASPAVSYCPHGPPHAASVHHMHQGRYHPHVPGSVRLMNLPHQSFQAAYRDDNRHRQRGGMWIDPYFERVGEQLQLLKFDGNEGSHSRACADKMKSPSVNPAIANARSPPPQSLEALLPPQKLNKRVRFSHLQIRTYETIMSDNPSCSGGPSLGIGWRYDPVHYVATIDEFAAHQARLYGTTQDGQPIEPRPEELVLHRCEREAMLMKVGYTRKDIVDSVRALNKAKSKRRQTVHNLPVSFVDERLEVVKRTLRRWILNKKRTRHMYEEWKRRSDAGG